MRPHTKMQLQPGLFFSPGYYMGFWYTCIETNFTQDVIGGHNKLQKHREMYASAIMAAAQTKATKIQHYVGLPDDEPSDVDIVKLANIIMPSGNKGTTMQRLNVQITECSFERGEVLLEQCKKKNNPAYAGIILAIYVTGRTEPSNFTKDRLDLQQIGKVYPSEIVIVESVEFADGVRQSAGTFGLTEIYPNEGASLVSLSDDEAFFIEPAVFSKGSKKVSIEWEDKGSFELMIPIIEDRKQRIT